MDLVARCVFFSVKVKYGVSEVGAHARWVLAGETGGAWREFFVIYI